MKKCWRCAEEIQDAAVACRFCNSNQASLEKDRLFSTAFNTPKHQVTDERLAPAKPMADFKRGAIVISGLIGLSVLASAIRTPPTSSTFSDAVTATTDEVASPAARGRAVTAKQLVAAYDANEMAAQQDFGNQILEVTGKMQSVDLDMGDDPVLHFAVPGTFTGVGAYFTSEGEKALVRFKKGDSVTIRCTSISETLGTPYLKDCEVL